jgi:hypothetical protein
MSMRQVTVHSETPNQAMPRPAGRTAFPLSMTFTLNVQPRSPSPAVVHLVLVRPMPVQLSQFVSLAGLMVVVLLLGAGCDHAARRNSRQTTFRIVATDAGFEAPDAVPIGLRHIVFENHGSEIHEALLEKLPATMSAADFQAEVKRRNLFPKGVQDYSGPGLMSPGETVEMWLRVDPGEYVLMCWNHLSTVSVRAFSVRAPILDDPPPTADVTLKLVDYRFEFQGKLHKGEQVIRIETPGPSMHEADLFRLHPGKTVADARKWRKENLPVAPADAIGGALSSSDIGTVV